MKNFCFAVIAVILLPVIYFSSCAKVEDNNVAQPTISNIRFNESDTIVYTDDSNIKRSIRFNDSVYALEYRKTDTLIPGKWVYISADLHADGKLSTFIVRGNLTYKSKSIKNYPDSIYEIIRSGQGIFSDKTDSTVYRNRLLQIPDTIIDNNRKLFLNNEWRTVVDTLYLYKEEPYKLMTVLMDRFGNVSDSTKDIRQIKFLTRKELRELKGK
ncbi:hypothetical protein GGR21_001629 [Dysgonomonas hofstadii]|uniref:Lipoprotein n=1 Tax=Dysgonomonas hofstadii TaxID=637886 RepID=A0A840CQ51_9BACT|nr:hypothetical protein [Dysgonomonas hofstadii]MBB4035734.1 hypothetical protein [Dysgonomonas hofstadii]